MAQSHAEVDRTGEAKDIAYAMESQHSTVTFSEKSEYSERYTFTFTGGCVHAHYLPDGWEFRGIGENWFAIGPVD